MKKKGKTMMVKVDEVFILTWIGTKTRQLGQSDKRNDGLG